MILCTGITVAQNIQKVAETPQFTDYVVTNDSLNVSAPFDLLIEYNQTGNSYRVMEQEIIRISSSKAGMKSLDHPLRDVIASTDTPVTEITSRDVVRRKQVANLLIHTARIDLRNQDELLVVKHLRLRVFHNDQAVISRSQQIQETPQPTSRLASGNWYRINFDQDGFYQLDGNFLSDLGIDLASVNPDHIQIWSTDGYELPLENSAPRPELRQIPIIVESGDNGSFGNNDRVIFYGNSLDKISYTPNRSISHDHKLHPYATTNSVFLTIGDQPGLRLEESTSNLSPARTITQFRDFVWKEEELHKSESRIKSGQEWFGQLFEANVNRTQTIFNDTIPGFDQTSEVTLELGMAARSESVSRFDFVFNGTTLDPLNITRIQRYNASTGNSANQVSRTQTHSIQSPDNVLQIDATFNPGDGQARGWVNYIRMNFTRSLVAKNNRLMIFPPEDGSSDSGARYVLQGFNNQPFVADVSNPTEPILISTSSNGNNYEFTYHTAPDHILYAASSFMRPLSGSTITNQNITSVSGYPDYIIITSEALKDQAVQLANYREQRDGLQSVVVTQRQIFSEFNGGVPDITAIRDYVRFLYNRAPDIDQLPSYLLFFGNTTFDYKGILGNSPMTNHVFTYQTPESVNRVGSYATDDFFGLLEPSKGAQVENTMIDIGIGRLPLNTPQEAELVLSKIERYESQSTRGDWRSIFTFLADDDVNPSSGFADRDLHILNADGVAQRIPQDESGVRVEKIYQIDYPTVNTASGARVPQATQAMVDRINNGSLIINFSGHGNEEFLTAQRLFTQQDIDRLNNRDKLSIFVTATCEYGRYDDNERFSGAERLLVSTEAGIVATFTTTRVVYTDASPTGSNNFALNIQLTEQMLLRDEQGLPRRLGDIYRGTKNTTAGQSRNSKKFILLGDPAMRIGLPESKINITSVNNIETESITNPIQLRALDRVTVEGNVALPDGRVNTAYNGEANIRVFDASRFVNFPPREWVPDQCRMPVCGYDIQNDILFNGRVSVENGRFSSEFIIPKDIAYSDTTGRIQIYSQSMDSDAIGSWSRFYVNGRNPDAIDDGTGPDIDLFLNDESFMNGVMVNDAPVIRAVLEDESGINTAGAGVGHEIVAILTKLGNAQNQRTFILNDFYQSDTNDFTRGTLEYPLQGLADGEYELTLRAWDVFNNVGESTIFFEVSESDDLEVRNLFNYPNPMHQFTRFVFEHNQPGNPMDINIRIYTLSGRPIAEIKREGFISGGNIVQIEWDGLDKDRDRLANGTYLYHTRITTDTQNGRQSYEKTERLVIIR